MPHPGTTAFERIWAEHLVGDDLLFCDLHLVQEVSSPQAFDGLRLAGRRVRRPDRNVPTTPGPILDPVSRTQVETLRANCAEFGVPLFPMGDPDQGIVHIISPQLGLTQPGMTIVCGDSHTSTHGAFGALAFGIGTSEVEHVLATQTLVQRPLSPVLVRYDGALGAGVTAKDMALAAMGAIGTSGGNGKVFEYRGAAVEGLSMEGRMTLCNMSIEAGARAGLVAPDDVTFAYLEGRPCAPADMDAAVARWRGYRSDDDAVFAQTWAIDATAIAPMVTWGTTPAQVAPVTGAVPAPADDGAARALAYMGLEAGQPLTGIPIDRVFIGSCTNGRIEDLEAAAAVVRGRSVARGVRELQLCAANVAALGSVSLTSYSIGGGLTNSRGARDDLPVALEQALQEAAEAGVKVGPCARRARHRHGVPTERRHRAMSLAAQRRGGGPPASGARTARPAVEQVATVTARGCRERTAYGSSASASRPREQLKARHAGCEAGHAKPLRVHCSGLGAPAQPPRRASLQRRPLAARRSRPWQCGRSAALRSSRAGRRPALGHLRARSLPPGRTRTRAATKTTTSARTAPTRTRPTRAAAKERKARASGSSRGDSSMRRPNGLRDISDDAPRPAGRQGRA